MGVRTTWVRRWRRLRHRASYGRVVSVEGPDDLEAMAARFARAVVVTGTPTRWVAFDCPCGGGHQQMLPTGQGGWRVALSDGRATLNPSVDDREHGCHFWLRDGDVRWV